MVAGIVAGSFLLGFMFTWQRTISELVTTPDFVMAPEGQPAMGLMATAQWRSFGELASGLNTKW